MVLGIPLYVLMSEMVLGVHTWVQYLRWFMVEMVLGIPLYVLMSEMVLGVCPHVGPVFEMV